MLLCMCCTMLLCVCVVYLFTEELGPCLVWTQRLDLLHVLGDEAEPVLGPLLREELLGDVVLHLMADMEEGRDGVVLYSSI